MKRKNLQETTAKGETERKKSNTMQKLLPVSEGRIQELETYDLNHHTQDGVQHKDNLVSLSATSEALLYLLQEWRESIVENFDPMDLAHNKVQV
jgi:hypothetical protein